MTKIKIKAFTLVELIIVITILAILSTIAFVSFQNYTATARDSNRQVTLKEISNSLETFKTVTSSYPTPENIYATGNILGTNLFQVGIIGDNISKLLKINKTPLDPISNTNYLYGLSLDNKYYQIAGTAENLSAGIISQTYAESNEKLKAVVEGNYKGLLYFSTGSNHYIANFPSIIFSRSGTYSGTGKYYIVNGKTNIPYSLKGNTFDNPKDENTLLTELYNSGVTLTGVVFNYSKDDFTKLSIIPTELGKLGIISKDTIGQTIYGNTYNSSIAWSAGGSGGGGVEACPTNPNPDTDFDFDTVNKTITLYKGSSLDVIIPCQIGGVDVENIGDSAFMGYGLNSIIIPKSVTSIGEGSFSENLLTSITISSSVTSIGNYAFSDNALTNITIPNSVTSIGDYAFGYNSLTNITIPSSVTSIGEGSFGENLLTNILIPSTVTSIGMQAFNSNNLPDSQAFIYKRNTDGSVDYSTIVSYGGLNKAPVIPNTVTYIGAYAFNNNQLISVTIPSSVISIGDYAFIDNSLTNITIPNSVTSIGDSAFSDNQLTSLIIPNSVTSIGDSAFSNNQLTSVTIPNSVISIGNSAFSINKLTSITIPDSVKNIGSLAFIKNNLTSGNIYIKCPLPTFGTQVFYYNGASRTTNIPNPITCTP